MKTDPSPAAPADIAFFEAHGYLIVPNIFDAADLAPLREQMKEAIDAKIRELHADGKVTRLHRNLDFEHRLIEIYRDSSENGEAVMRHLEGTRGGGLRSREMFNLISHPKLLAKVASLLRSEEVVASSVYRVRPKVPHVGRGIVPWHQDSGYFAPHCDREMIITCWIPLVDATVENGCMRILPDAHRGPVARHRLGGNAGFLVIPDENLPANPDTSVVAACPRGGVVFMTNRTPHCSTPNYSDHIRWSIDLRYQSADVPNNVGLWPATSPSPTPDFSAKVTVACYPPEADFLVRSRQNPSEVADYAEFARRREAYESARLDFSPRNRWADPVRT